MTKLSSRLQKAFRTGMRTCLADALVMGHAGMRALAGRQSK
jgi:hypothetical protein